MRISTMAGTDDRRLEPKGTLDLVIWRSVIVAGYLGLAITVGVTYGLRGLASLGFFYVCAGAWVALLLSWGSIARRAGRWNVDRLDTPSHEVRSGDSHPRDGHPQVAAEAVPVLARRARASRRRPATAV